jgi:ribosomal-protein-alanine N-acetyltransferase
VPDGHDDADPTRAAAARPVAARAVPYTRAYLDASTRWFADEELRRLTLAPAFDPDSQEAWFRSLAQRTDYLVWGVEVDGRPAGAFGLKGITSADAEYFGYLGLPELRGRGLGRWMLDTALARAAERGLGRVWLRVGVDNPRARHAYRRRGFVSVSSEAGVEIMELTL